ncbi:protein spartin [Lepeophtheirus salmonis]|uniref:protein spartin n=1 Tax=Lepeophtheirus salmonis TaxID=72036 RepID=UPI001AE514ED|nr:spartin-like [Lepeophtheirus salmonis]XP_040569524.1 spartin-like [Lepeophtheirus salmonis]XP_040569525.1 spartin-like [Lepeophtheirus salmonis]
MAEIKTLHTPEKSDEGLFQLEMAVAIDQANYPIDEVIKGYSIALRQIKSRGDWPEAELQIKFRLKELKNEAIPTLVNEDVILPSSANILFSIEGLPLKLFYVQSNQNLFQDHQVNGLYIYKFNDSLDDNDSPTFLQISSWIYPLARGKSSIFRSPDGNYLFPDLVKSNWDNAIGLIFSKALTIDQKSMFDNMLNELVRPPGSMEQYETFSSQMSFGLVKGAEAIGVSMVNGAINTSAALHSLTDNLKNKMSPQEEPLRVNPFVKTSLHVANWCTEKGVISTGFLLSKVGTGTLVLGKMLAPLVQTQSVKALSYLQNQPEERSKKQFDILSNVVDGTVTAVSTLYTAVENSAKVIAKNAANSTVQVVTHKYGVDVGDATNSALSSVGNAYLTAYNAGALTVKGVAKRTVKDTSKLSLNVSEDLVAGKVDPLKVMDKPKLDEEL